MKIQVVSDVHLEWDRKFRPDRVARDLLIVAGDLAEGAFGRKFLEDELAYSPVVYVPGNHEYYNQNFQKLNQCWRAIADELPDLYFATADNLKIPLRSGEVCRLAGTTLWSNFWGSPVHALVCEQTMNDFNMITYGREAPRGMRSTLFNAGDCALEHQRSVEFLDRVVEPVDVVVTHFAPSRRSLDKRFLGTLYEPLNPYYSNDLDHVVERIGAPLWVHGHTHASMDYWIGGTRVLCNPKGYRTENGEFDPGLVVEL